MLLLIGSIPPHEQVWGESEDIAVAILLGVAVLLTLILAGVFFFILTRKEK